MGRGAFWAASGMRGRGGLEIGRWTQPYVADGAKTSAPLVTGWIAQSAVLPSHAQKRGLIPS
jgi:hypothetical protein